MEEKSGPITEEKPFVQVAGLAARGEANREASLSGGNLCLSGNILYNCIILLKDKCKSRKGVKILGIVWSKIQLKRFLKFDIIQHINIVRN